MESWLKSLGFQEYWHHFQKEGFVDLQQHLPLLTDERLQKVLHVEKCADRIILLQSAQEYLIFHRKNKNSNNKKSSSSFSLRSSGGLRKLCLSPQSNTNGDDDEDKWMVSVMDILKQIIPDPQQVPMFWRRKFLQQKDTNLHAAAVLKQVQFRFKFPGDEGHPTCAISAPKGMLYLLRVLATRCKNSKHREAAETYLLSDMCLSELVTMCDSDQEKANRMIEEQLETIRLDKKVLSETEGTYIANPFSQDPTTWTTDLFQKYFTNHPIPFAPGESPPFYILEERGTTRDKQFQCVFEGFKEYPVWIPSSCLSRKFPKVRDAIRDFREASSAIPCIEKKNQVQKRKFADIMNSIIDRACDEIGKRRQQQQQQQQQQKEEEEEDDDDDNIIGFESFTKDHKNKQE